jgi:glucose/arabinose dehydrogenase
MFLATVKDVYVADIQKDGTLANLTRIIDDLPDGGQHPNRTLAVGPDEKLYITVGSTCNACDETNPEAATIPAPRWTARVARSSPPACGTRSVLAGTRRAGCGAWITASTGWATTISRRK